MAFTELYVDQSGSGASENGGSNAGAPHMTTTSCTLTGASNPYTLTIGAGTWPGAVVAGDFLTWDIVTAKLHGKITNVDSTTKLSVAFPSTPSTGTNNVIIGGAWASLYQASLKINQWAASKWPASTNSPRINIAYAGGAAYATESNLINLSGIWSATIPLVISTYVSSAGDVDWTTSTSRAIIEFGTGVGYISLTGTYIEIYSLRVNVAKVTSHYNFYLNGGITTLVANCHAHDGSVGATAYSFFVQGIGTRIIRCLATRVNGSIAIGFCCAVRCFIFGCMSSGITVDGTGYLCATYTVLMKCRSIQCATGYDIQGQAILQWCDYANCTTGYKFDTAADQYSSIIMSSLFPAATTGLAGQVGFAPLIVFNSYYTGGTDHTNVVLSGNGDKASLASSRDSKFIFADGTTMNYDDMGAIDRPHIDPNQLSRDRQSQFERNVL